MHTIIQKEVSRFETSRGREIYAIAMQAFPQLVANVYLVNTGSGWILIDCGSGMEESNQDFLRGLKFIQERFGPAISPADIEAILITHGHIDHFGGLPFIRQISDAPIGVHPLDRRILSHYEERVIVASRHLENFLRHAGVSPEYLANLMAMYLFAKGTYRSTDVQFAIVEGALDWDGMRAFHVPGHCPGQVCLMVDEVLLTADQVLASTTPHQAPESITNNMGLGHYLDSLDKIGQLEGVRIALGGHEAPMPDLSGRVQAIKEMHQNRLERVLAICKEPRSIAEISLELFGRVSSYHVLLALEETGAHVEYLYQYGKVMASNLAEIENDPRAVIRYLAA